MSADSAEQSTLRTGARPKQARSEQTLQRILDASERLICDRGLAAVSIADIVREAGSSVGAFYGRFKDKDELLLAISERQQGAIRDRLAALDRPEPWTGQSLEEIVGALIAALSEHTKDRQRVIAAFLEAAARHPGRWAPAVAFRAEVVERAVSILLLRKHDIDHADPARAAHFAVRQAFALFDVRCLYAESAGFLDDLHIAEEAAASICAYLRFGAKTRAC